MVYRRENDCSEHKKQASHFLKSFRKKALHYHHGKQSEQHELNLRGI